MIFEKIKTISHRSRRLKRSLDFAGSALHSGIRWQPGGGCLSLECLLEPGWHRSDRGCQISEEQSTFWAEPPLWAARCCLTFVNGSALLSTSWWIEVFWCFVFGRRLKSSVLGPSDFSWPSCYMDRAKFQPLEASAHKTSCLTRAGARKPGGNLKSSLL